MPKLPFFTGDFYQIDDPAFNTAQLVNLYPEVDESGTAKAIGRLVGTPGLQRFANVGSGPIRGLRMWGGRMFCVSGPRFYEVFADGSFNDYGEVGWENPQVPIQMFQDGDEILVISAGYAWRVYGDDTGYHVEHIKLIAAEYTDLAVGVQAFYYDLQIDGSDATKVTSSTRPFVAGDVGLSLKILSGTGFTVTTRTISSVSGGVATLSGSAGTMGSTLGVALLLDGTDTTVNSPTIPFEDGDVGGTLVFPDPNAPNFTPGTYRILSVTDGVATLNSSPGSAAAVNGVATQYPGESMATDADGNLKALCGAYQDGYGIIAPPKEPKTLTNVFYINDQSVGGFQRWVALDKGTKEAYPDDILNLLADHQELYIFGAEQSTEAWRDTGAANFPYERDMGAIMHFGLAAKDSVCQLGTNGIAWLAWSSNRGTPQAMYAVGFQPQRVSTPALERLWHSYPAGVADAVAYSYIEDTHHFWVITFPSADVTWVYDLTASQQMGRPMWHVRGWWDGTKQRRQRQWVHAYGYFVADPDHPGPDWTLGLSHFVGDWENNSVYVAGLYTYDEVGSQIRRQIIFPHLSNENKRTTWSLFEIECRVGGGATGASDAGASGEIGDVVWTLDYSRDKGNTFVNPRERTALTGGRTNQRLRWLRCGESRDQVWRLETAARAPISITAAWFDGKGASS